MLKNVRNSDAYEESDGDGPRSRKARARWTRLAVTLLLLLAVAVTGTMAYSARQQWWQIMLSIGKG